ncbi:Actin-like ATPase domain-containing protein [Mycena sanguinolenta]|uniref:Actin-like ATPase domain-containing protein n=1 Tax=Mycena sanguinolenta TaxID=230812 RepID=A0A8H6ZAU9_9AGAR|nr:Actin-like ATPase domain-containing protein [Mycena sanguinolenta]
MHIIPLALALVSLLPRSTLASVLAIDYGTDWMKASVMSPGVPFDVLLNKDSKRKIQASVGWKKTDRLFSTDAFNLASRFPSDSFSSLKYLQAAPFDSDIVSYYTTISTAEVLKTSRNTVALKQSDGNEWSVEELIGMQFSYVKQLAEGVAGEKVTDVVITVPPYFSQFQRDAVVDAVEIAGMRTLTLINDGTAVAVNYAMTRTFPTPEYHIIYDAGASSIRATLVSFSTPDATTGTQIVVAGVGYDLSTGGTELDRRLREILIEAFNTKHKKDIREDKRGMAKLWKEAGRVKAILSANTDATATVESLAWDIDFKAKVSRAEFEAACEDLKPRFAQPIEEALRNANLTLDDVTSVILTGGSTRTPMIQAALKAAVGEDKIALNVNADEAAVLGAALHGAGLSRQFKTKNIKVTDISLHDIQASYLATAATPRTITSLLFPAGSKAGSKKVMTFKRKEDFTINFDYKDTVAPGFPRRFLEVGIEGVAEAIANLTELGALDPVVKATVVLSESGFISVSNAVAFGEIKDDSIAGKLKGFFGAGSSSEAEVSSEHTPPRESSSSSSESPKPSASNNSTPEKEKEEKKKATPKDNTITLNTTVVFPTIPPMTADHKKNARSRLRAIDLDEAAVARKEEARNSLEGYLYRMRDLLDEENRDTPFKQCSQEEERKAIAAKLDESFEWLHDKGDVAETSQFLDKRNALETLERPIIHRYKEIEAFPQALNNSQMWNWSTRLFLTEARENMTIEAAAELPSKWTKEELDALEKSLKEHETWLNEWVEKQKAVKMNEDPVIETTEMKARAKVLETALMKLVKRKVPKAAKKKKETTTSEEPTSTSAAAEETMSAADVPEAEESLIPTATPVVPEEEQVPLPTHDEL